MTTRRGFLIGIGAALAAPAIVRAESLMKVAALRESVLLPSADRWVLSQAWQVKIFRAYLAQSEPISISPVSLAA